MRIDDEELALYAAGDDDSVTSRMARDLRDLRAAGEASRERVRGVVRSACLAVERKAVTAVPIHELDAIIDRADDALAAPPPHDDRRPLPPEVATGALQDTVHDDVGPSRPARSVRDLGELGASGAAPQPVLDAAQVRDVVRGSVLEFIRPTDEDASAQWRRVDAIASRVAEQLAGQAVALSAEERDILRWVREEAVLYLGQSSRITKGDLAKRAIVFVDRLLSAPGQVASPAAKPCYQDPSHGSAWCAVPGPRAWAVTLERVEALRWARRHLAAGASTGACEATRQALDAMLAEVSP